MTIGDRIRILRASKNETQAELANVIGIAQSSIGNYERGERIPDAETLIKYSKYFNVSSDYLLGLTVVSQFNATLEDAYLEINRLKSIIKNTDIMIDTIKLALKLEKISIPKKTS